MEKKINVLHVASMIKYRVGIVQQMQWETTSAKVLKIPWETKLYCPRNLTDDTFSCIKHSPCIRIDNSQVFLRELYTWLRLQKEFYQWLENEIKQYDLLLLRYSINDPFLYSFLRRAGIPVVLVHHTLETFELAMRPGPASVLRALAEKLMGKRSLQAASGIIAVTQEIVDYEIARRKGNDIPTTVYPNGIYYKKTPADDHRTKEPELIMVASFFHAWHGLDLLLDSMESCSESFTLHLVGELPAVYKARASNKKRIHIHNSLTHNQIKRLAASCWVGLSSFALHRKHMQQACTLKVREYLMMGLPVYADYEENFPPAFPYFCKGEANIENILLFAKKMRSVSRESVAEIAEPYISKTGLLKGLYQWLLKSY
ncbi:MAG: glycosyltransferase [Candidatus Electrothrix sp. YB6]